MRPHDDVYVCYVQSCSCLTDMLKRALKSSRLAEDDFMYDDADSGSRAMTAESPPTSSRAGSDVTDIDWMKRGGLLKRRKLIHAFIRRVEYKIRQVIAVGSLSAINQTGAYYTGHTHTSSTYSLRQNFCKEITMHILCRTFDANFLTLVLFF